LRVEKLVVLQPRILLITFSLKREIGCCGDRHCIARAFSFFRLGLLYSFSLISQVAFPRVTVSISDVVIFLVEIEGESAPQAYVSYAL